MEFKVKGVTFENEDGKNIQSIIKKEIKELKDNDLIGEKYEGYTNAEIKEMDLNVQEYSDVIFDVKLVEDTFEGKLCVKVYIETEQGSYVHVGYMPKNLLNQYKQYKTDNDKLIGIATLTGGRYKYCNYDDEDYEEGKIETKQLDYGLLVEIKLGNEPKNDINLNINNNEQIVETKAEQKEKPIYNKWWFWLIVFLVIGLISGNS